MPTRREPAPSGFRPDLVPRWAKLACWTVLASVMPSVLWRMITTVHGMATGDNPCVNPSVTPWFETVYVIGILPVVQIGLALLTFGLIRRWGEVFPHWMPLIGDRRVPVAFGVVLALVGVVLTSAFMLNGVFVDAEPLRELPPGCTQPGWEVRRYYLPMVLWPPLLLAVTVHYRRRRAAEERE